MKMRASLSVVIGIVMSLVLSSLADERQWRRVAWEGRRVYSVAIPPDSANVIYATVGGPDASAVGVHKSYDDGLTWDFLPESSNEWANILTIDPKSSRTVYYGSGAILFDPGFPDDYPRRTRDAGEHWETILAPLCRIVPSPWTDGLLLATGRAWGGWSLDRSTDDGSTWTGLSGTEVGAGLSDNVIFHHADSLVVFSWIDLYPDGGFGLARSNDAGLTWEVILEGTISAFDQDPSDGDHWAAMEHRGQRESALFAESFDNGETWDKWPLPDPILHIGQLSFDMSSPQIIYVVDNLGDGVGIYRSTDGGHTWVPMNDGFPSSDFTFEIFQTRGKPGRLLAARSDGLWEWTNQQTAENPEEVVSRILCIESVSPCPFGGMVHARMIIPRDGTVQARVYSINGAFVRQLFARTFSEGSHDFIWDGRTKSGQEVPPAVYILRVQAGEEQAIRRMVKLR